MRHAVWLILHQGIIITEINHQKLEISEGIEKNMIKITSIIIAEDDFDDRLLLEDALNDNNIPSENLEFVSDGDELLRLLRNKPNGQYMVFLDLNMPKKDGRQTLQEIKSDSELKNIPVVILSTSNAKEDIEMSYKNGANTYFTKPNKYSELVEVMAVIKSYWWDKASYYPS